MNLRKLAHTLMSALILGAIVMFLIGSLSLVATLVSKF